MEIPVLPVEALARAWGPGPWGTAVLLPGGKSAHWRVATPAGDVVVRRSYRGKTAAGLHFEHALMAHLRAGGFPAPDVVPTAAGATGVEHDGRLWRVTRFVAGHPFAGGHGPHVDALAAALADYHRLAASFRPPGPVPVEPPVFESLRERLAGLDVTGDSRLAGAAAVAARLEACYRELPRTVIHGGCRRGSAVFRGDDLAAVLDFDSARAEVRVMDLVVAVHDVAKVYGDPASTDFKVPLDLHLAARFLGAYRAAAAGAGQPLQAAELAALPLLLAAKRLKRALGRYRRVVTGEAVSDGDRRKIDLELARVAWLDDHRAELEGVLSAAVAAG